jgi:hypothetical protein
MSTLEANGGPLKVAIDDALQQLKLAEYDFKVASAALVHMVRIFAHVMHDTTPDPC